MQLTPYQNEELWTFYRQTRTPTAEEFKGLEQKLGLPEELIHTRFLNQRYRDDINKQRALMEHPQIEFGQPNHAQYQHLTAYQSEELWSFYEKTGMPTTEEFEGLAQTLGLSKELIHMSNNRETVLRDYINQEKALSYRHKEFGRTIQVTKQSRNQRRKRNCREKTSDKAQAQSEVKVQTKSDQAQNQAQRDFQTQIKDQLAQMQAQLQALSSQISHQSHALIQHAVQSSYQERLQVQTQPLNEDSQKQAQTRLKAQLPNLTPLESLTHLANPCQTHTPNQAREKPELDQNPAAHQDATFQTQVQLEEKKDLEFYKNYYLLIKDQLEKISDSNQNLKARNKMLNQANNSLRVRNKDLSRENQDLKATNQSGKVQFEYDKAQLESKIQGLEQYQEDQIDGLIAQQEAQIEPEKVRMEPKILGLENADPNYDTQVEGLKAQHLELKSDQKEPDTAQTNLDFKAQIECLKTQFTAEKEELKREMNGLKETWRVSGKLMNTLMKEAIDLRKSKAALQDELAN